MSAAREAPVDMAGEHCALGPLAMADRHPTPKPALQGGKIGSACQRESIPPWRCTFAVLGHALRPVKKQQGASPSSGRSESSPSAVRMVSPMPQPSRLRVPNRAACRTTSDGGRPAAS